MSAASPRAVQLVLAVIAAELAAVPWLRSFPASVAAVPLFGAALLSVVLPLVTVRVRRERRGPRPIAVALIVDLAALLAYLLAVVLRGEGGLSAVATGLLHGPSQLLTFALPLVSPRSLLIAPVVLTWLAGSTVGEAIARRSVSIAPQCALLVAFGCAYAATLRATASASVRLQETLLAAALLACLLLLRASQVWAADVGAVAAEPTPAHDLRAVSLAGAAAAVAALAVTVLATVAVHSGVFPDRPTVPQRIPSVQTATQVNPLAFIAGLRPTTAAATSSATTLFTVDVDAPTPGYFSLANVDTYDGSGWSFTRRFLPSGGVLPPDADPGLGGGQTVNQQYRLAPGALTGAPWLPLLDRAASVTGLAVNIDPASGMVVPANPLGRRAGYSARSTVVTRTFDRLDPGAISPDVATPAADSELPLTLHATLSRIVEALASETGVPSSSPMAFLQAVQRDFRAHYALAGPTTNAEQRAGGTGFSDVIASILGEQRTATPEQYATLTVLLARDLGIPARVVAGFRVNPPPTAELLTPGTYPVTAAQAWSWAEVAITGVGWVALDTSPTALRSLHPDPASGAAATPTPTATPTGNALITNSNNGNSVGKRSQVSPEGNGRQLTLLTVLGTAVIALLVVLALVLLLRKRFRVLRRRRATTPRRLAASAWDEALDRLCEAGLADTVLLDALTSAEVADRTQHQFGVAVAEHTRRVGTIAERALYRQHDPVKLAEAEGAWLAERELTRALNEQLGLRGQLRAASRYRHQHRRIRNGRHRDPRRH